jgi:two-component system sensor histidine kinase SenX3
MTVVAVVVSVLAVGAIAALVSWRMQQRTVRRLVEVVENLWGTTPEGMRNDVGIARLERSVQRARERDDQVHQAEARLELALSEMTQGAVVCDERGAVVYRNAFAQTFAGARHGEALVEAAVQELLTAARAGRSNDRVLDLYGPPRRVLVVHAAPLRAGERILGAIAVIDDVTEIQRIEAIRRDFVANVSHELKTPIGALALLAETLAGETDPAVVQRLSDRVRIEAFRVSNIVDDLLTLSRIERQDSTDRDEFGIDLFVRECVDRVHPAAEQAGVELVTAPIDPELRHVGDRQQLTSALANLLENAVKYSEPGTAVEVRVHADDDRLAIAVHDHGIGIPSTEHERIFERFYRVDKARSRDTGGSGLGLSIARHAVRNHGGDITVVSREGEGSAFTIVLPRHTELLR